MIFLGINQTLSFWTAHSASWLDCTVRIRRGTSDSNHISYLSTQTRRLWSEKVALR